ncbi:alcohol dehydrogenase [Phytophthora cinnamomi]|uniref:alcohol dehydrogenase n=1 Tax=Phytophthora cinnamomi TaxID=4785 RepID=UPI0035597876|nr:alcohol dehydrogenase [Phytophthora cinnamomi]
MCVSTPPPEKKRRGHDENDGLVSDESNGTAEEVTHAAYPEELKGEILKHALVGCGLLEPTVAQPDHYSRRLQQQERVAEQHARQWVKRQIEEFTMAYQHDQLAAEKTRKQMECLARKRMEQQRQLDQLRLAVEGGEHVMAASEERQLKRIAGYGL